MVILSLCGPVSFLDAKSTWPNAVIKFTLHSPPHSSESRPIWSSFELVFFCQIHGFGVFYAFLEQIHIRIFIAANLYLPALVTSSLDGSRLFSREQAKMHTTDIIIHIWYPFQRFVQLHLQDTATNALFCAKTVERGVSSVSASLTITQWLDLHLQSVAWPQKYTSLFY